MKHIDHFYKKIHGYFDWESLYSQIVSKSENTSHFVEIGCFKGKSSAYLATEINNSGKNIKLDCIDLWDDLYDDKSGTLKSTKVQCNLYETFLSNIEPVKHIINPIRCDSHTSSNFFKNESLDFVYIDANHFYDYVKKDIELWYPKIKKGGILAGHDFINNNNCQVKQAVEEFCKNNNLIVKPGPTRSWSIQIE